MNANKVWASVGESLPALFEFLPGVSEGFKVRTPFLYPDGGFVDVFVLEREEGFTVTDFGDALGWLATQSVSSRKTPRQQLLIEDACQTVGVKLHQSQLMLCAVNYIELSEAIIKVAQAVVRLSDLWFTLRGKALQTMADQVSEYLYERKIQHDRRVIHPGRSGRDWTVDFQTQIENHRTLVFLLTTGSRGAARRISEPVLAGCVDLSHLKKSDPNLGFVSLFDDTEDVWQGEDFTLVEDFSRVARWSSPDELELLLKMA